MRLQRTLVLLLLGAGVSFACAQTAPRAIRPATAPLDINTATAQQLNALPGFGPAYTRRVIAGRPYSAKNQLFTRGIVPQGTYERIADLIVAHRVLPPSRR